MSKDNDETLVERVERYLQEVSARLHKFIFDDDEDSPSPINFNIHEVDCTAIVEFVLAEYIQVQDGA
jgi:selenocysteine lyase/cysteine desulfurase